MNSKVQLIRNQTLKIDYGGKTFLIDPILAKKGTYDGYAGTVNSNVRNPTVELPVSIESILEYDILILTHLHPDHWDQEAIRTLPKDKPVLCQNEEDLKSIKESGFTNVSIFGDKEFYKISSTNIKLIPTKCQHGSDEAYKIKELAELLGKVTGVIFQQENEPSIYLVGDTIWNKQIENNLKQYKPDYTIINTGDAKLVNYGSIIMGKQDTLNVRSSLSDSTIICVHMEAINHCVLTRKELKEFIHDKNLKNIIVPNDGEIIQIKKNN